MMNCEPWECAWGISIHHRLVPCYKAKAMTTVISRSAAGATALAYSTPAALVPSEFDSAFDAERARFLRRRFIWFCAFSTVSGLLWAVPPLLSRVGNAKPPRGQLVEVGGLGFDALLYVAG